MSTIPATIHIAFSDDGQHIRFWTADAARAELFRREVGAGTTAWHTDEWRAMAYAPTDGTEIELLIRHRSWWPAKKNGEDLSLWEGPCRGQWLDFNGGGWSWAGHMGTPIGWRPLAIMGAVE